MYLSTDGSKFVERNDIVEMGAGGGLCSLVCCQLQPKSVIATDLPCVVPHVEKNVALSPQTSLLVVKEWDWHFPWCFSHLIESNSPLLLAADCVFQEDHVGLVLKALSSFFSKHPKALCIFAHKDRRSELTQNFISRAQSGHRLRISEVSAIGRK